MEKTIKYKMLCSRSSGRVFSVLLLNLILFLYCSVCTANAFIRDSLLLHQSHLQENINRKGMLVLGSVSLSQLCYSIPSAFNSTGSAKYFHKMNIAWGGINLALALPGYFSARKEGLLLLQKKMIRMNSVL